LSGLTQWQSQHTRAALVISAGLALLGALLPAPSGVIQLIVLATLVALLGLPHGAVDHWQGHALLQPMLGRLWTVGFGLGYLAASGLVLVAWVTWPPLLLVAFLTLAAAHFGSEDWQAAAAVPETGPLIRLGDMALRGSIPVLLPIAFHGPETAALFAALLPYTSVANTNATVAAVGLITPAYLAALAVAIYTAVRRGNRLVGGEIAIHTAVFAALPPLLAFSVYFCLWHSPRHSLMVIADAGYADFAAGMKRFVQGAGLLTSLTIAGGAVAWFILQRPFSNADATLQVVFIGLAALTVPHVLLPLMRRWWRNASRAS